MLTQRAFRVLDRKRAAVALVASGQVLAVQAGDPGPHPDLDTQHAWAESPALNAGPSADPNNRGRADCHLAACPQMDLGLRPNEGLQQRAAALR
jgi:hypothetical protein